MSQPMISKLPPAIFWLGIYDKINSFQKFTNRLHRTETSQMICTANHSTGFMMGATRESLK